MTRTKKSRFSLQRLLVVCFAASTIQAIYCNHIIDFALEPSLTTIVQSGHSAVLDCAIQSTNYTLDSIHIQWLDSDGQPILFLGDNYRSQLLNNSLYISNVLPDMGLLGQYQCKATLPNSAGSIVSRRARLELGWLGEAFDEEPNGEVKVDAGEKVHFPCRITGEPSPVRVRWLKDERPLAIDELRMAILPNGGLEIDEISETDQGTYRCNASSMNLHRLSGKANLILNNDLEEAALPKAPTFIVKPQSRVTVTEGQTVTLDCAANGNPRPKVKWLKDGANIDMADLDSRFSKVGTTSSLKISNIKEEDGGSYQCLAENREDSIDASSTIQVQVPPKFKRKPSDKIEYVSKDVELECVVYGKPEPEVQWLKNGELIHPTGYHQIVNGNNLKIMGLLQSDTGLFQCIATNAAGNIQGSASLKVIGQADTPQASNKKQRNRKKFNSKSLTNAPQQPDDPFQASSQASFASLRPSSQVARPKTDTFQFLTSLSSSSASDNAPSNTNLGSTLNAYSAKQRKRLQQQPNHNQNEQFDESLFDDVEAGVGSSWSDGDDGDYEGGGGGDSRPGPPLDVAAIVTKARFVVISWKPPIVNGGDIITYSVFYKQDGNLRERVQNTTSPGNLRRPSYRNLEEAHLSNLQPSTTYLIRVVAWNHRGMGRSSQSVSITTAYEENNVPGTPRHLHAYATSPRSTHVQWTEPEVTSDISGEDVRYRVNYMETGDGVVGEQHSVETVNTQIELNSLTPHTLYTISVESLSLSDISPPTSDVTVRTFSSLPTEPPQNVTFDSTSSAAAAAAAIMVHWEPPPLHSQNGVITGYKIRYRVKGNKADTTSVEGDKREWAMPRGVALRGDSVSYQVRLWAMNVNGSGPPTDWLEVVDTYESDLDESRVPDEPGELRTKATGNSITVYWTPPHSNIIRIRNYIISWGKGVPDMYSHELAEREREFTITPLEAQSEYVVSLRASNEMGAGAPKYATLRTVVDAADRLGLGDGGEEGRVPLLPPVGVKAQVLGETSAVLYWTDTNSKGGGYGMGGENRYYVVQYKAEGLKAKEVNATTNNMLLGDLRPGTMYEFMVKLVKGRRESPWSMLVANYTAGAPTSLNAAPRELQVKLLQDDSQMVRLSWLPPKPSGTNINGYVILYTTDQNRRDRDWNATAVKGDRLTYEMTNLEPSTMYYFKIQARINKGNGPFSAVAQIETGPNIGIPPPVNKAGVFSGTMLLYLIAAALVLVVTTIILVVFCLCCRGRSGSDAHMIGTQLGTSPDRSKKGYQGVSSGMGGGTGGGMGGIKPPDLWIHHDQMELKQMDCGKGGSGGGGSSGGDCASSSGALTLPRGSTGAADDYDGGHHGNHGNHNLNSLDKHPGHGYGGYAPTYMAVATASASAMNTTPINTSISSTTPLSGHHCDRDMSTPVRPSLSMATPQYITQHQQPSMLQQRTLPQYHHDNGQSTLYTGSAATTAYDPYSTTGSGYGGGSAGLAACGGGNTGIGGVQHPLKSFTVPAPPPISAPGTPKHVVTLSPPLHPPVSYYHHQQQQQPLLVRPTASVTTTNTSSNQSPYKKPSSSIVVVQPPCIGNNGGSSGSSTPPTALLTSQQPRTCSAALAPPHSAEEMQRLTAGVRPSHSTEELNQEMEHLKGLMITLNKITASEFEC